MDPNATLESLLEEARDFVLRTDAAESEAEARYERESTNVTLLAAHAIALDEWIRSGGSLPEAWNTKLTSGTRAQGIALANMAQLTNLNAATVRPQPANAFTLPNFWVVTYSDNFECGIAPDGSVSS